MPQVLILRCVWARLTDTPFLAFGEVAGVDLGGLSPVKLPPWVVDTSLPDSQTAERLVGQEVL